MLAESSYVTEGVGKRPPDEKDYRSLEPEYDYSPSNWLEWKKHILAQKQSDDDRNSFKRRTEGRLLNELKYSLDAEADGPGKPVVTIIKKDETMSRKIQPAQHAAHTMPYAQRAAVSPRSPVASTPRPVLKRQTSLPAKPNYAHLSKEERMQREREEEFIRPTTPTRLVSPPAPGNRKVRIRIADMPPAVGSRVPKQEEIQFNQQDPIQKRGGWRLLPYRQSAPEASGRH